MSEPVKIRVEVLDRGFVVEKDDSKVGCPNVQELINEIGRAVQAFQTKLLLGERFAVEIYILGVEE